jgi:predicted metallopeptidase
MNKNDVLRPDDTISSNKQLMESPEIEKIADEIIDRETLDFGPAEIGYFLVYPNLSKYRAAKCKKTSREVKYYSGNDYLIEISGEMWDMLDQETREMVVFHQLLHVDPVYKAKNQEWKMKVRKPDFNDFYEINDKYGNEWYKTVQAAVSSLYDLDPRGESKVSL